MTAQQKSRTARAKGPARRQAEAPKPTSASGIDPQVSGRFFPLLLLLFFGSGCAALIYEIVWFQLLELTIGSSAISIAVLLATFMGGMCIGSLGLARVVSIERHPLQVYAWLEFGVGICGLLVLLLVPYAGGLYAAIGGHGIGGLLFRGLLSAICLLTPTILMGATLPAISRWIESTPRGVSWLGFLYGGNTLGAVAGCLLAGFYLLRVHDMFFATYVAIAINALIGGAALWLSRAASYAPQRERQAATDGRRSRPIWPVLVTIGLSGLTALSAEVVWTRLLSLLLDGTVYAYSLILAAILLGIAIGSYAGSFVARSRANPRTALGVCQILLAAGIAWSAYWLTAVLPYRTTDPAVLASPTGTFQHDLLSCLVTVLPAALLWGASFPLALAAVARHDADPGRDVGSVYAANTIGAIIGALGTSLLAMALLGSQHIQQALVCIAAFSGALMLLPVGTGQKQNASVAVRAAALVSIPLIVAVLLASTVRPVPGPLVGYGRYSAKWQSASDAFIYIGEGMNSTIAVSRFPNGVLNYHNAGKVQASSEPQDLRLERMLGHLTTLVPQHPQSVLVIGCGAGVTAGAVSIDPQVRHVTIVEIEPLVPKAAQAYFAEFNGAVVASPKTNVVIDDGRHYLMTSREKYDAITCDPFDPWTKGAATLSTREFYESVKAHLKPGGVVTVWVPLYETRLETVKSEIATFMSVFPNGVVWGNTSNGRGYDVVLQGRVNDTPIDLDAIQARVTQPEYGRVRDSLASVGFATSDALFADFAGQGPDLEPWLADAQLNRDRNLRLQYLAGVGVYNNDSDLIYQDMIGHRTWPKALFAGSPERLATLRKAILGQ